MGSGGDSRPGGGDDSAGGIGGRDGVLAALRVALVLVLLGLAAHGLSGRRGLDWSRLTQRPATPVLAVVLLGAAAVAVVLVLLTVRQLLRAAAAVGGPDEDEPLPEARRLSPWAYPAAALAFALVGLLVYTAVRYALPVDQAATDPGRSGSEAPGADPDRLLGGLSLTGALLAAVTVALLLGLRAASRRPGPAKDAEQGAAVDDRREPTAEPLAGAVTAAQEQLAAHGRRSRVPASSPMIPREPPSSSAV